MHQRPPVSLLRREGGQGNSQERGRQRGGFRVQVMSLSGTVGSLGQRGPRATAAWALIATGSMLSMASRCWGEDSRGMQSRKALNV